jgi:membrane fusion protein (multidrug efflux system)
VAGADIDATRITVEATTSALQKAKADLSAAQARADGVDAAMESAQADVSAAMAQLAAQEAAVRDAQRQLNNTTLAAPTDGRVGQKNVEVGNLVQPGQPLFAVVGGDYWIVANFKESQIRKMEAGQPVEITVDAIAGHKFEGHVDSIAPATGAQFALLPPDNATGNFTKVVQRVPVKIVFDAESTHGFEARLRPGLSAVVGVRVKALTGK